jgi:toxin ParE1/3/4
VSYSILLVEDVYADLWEAGSWYKEQRDGLQDEFINSFEECLERILLNPLGYQLKSGKARYVMLHRFPFKVFYKIYGNEIKIYGIIHAKRDSKHIRKRLKRK